VWRNQAHRIRPCEVTVSGQDNHLSFTIIQKDRNKMMELEVSGIEQLVQIKEWCEHLLAQQGYFKAPMDR
jgi:hypothetical protein